MAAAGQFRVTVTGKGGHAAMPQTVVDPIVAAAGIVGAVQTIVSRETDPLGSSVISVTRIHAGDAYNVIPDEVEFGGTLRARDEATMARLRERFQEVVELEARVHGCTATVDWMEDVMPYYPPTVNDARMAALVQSVAQVGGRGAGPARALPPRPTHACPPHPRSVCWGRGGWRTPPRPWRARILALLRGFCLPRTPSWGSGTRTLGPSGRYTRLGSCWTSACCRWARHCTPR